jgi:TolB-like protein
VIARNTAFTFKGKNIDAKEIGKDLGVRYVLEGSVQRDQNRVRVNAQLIDSESGAHLWADRFEEDITDLFKLQDEVVARLANTLGIELVKAEERKGAGAGNPDAVDLVMRGQALLQRRPTPKDKNDAARALFEQALKIDPSDADALAGEAYTYFNEYSYSWNLATDYDANILVRADRAIALAPDDLNAYFVKAAYLYLSRRGKESLDAANAGLAINPNYGLLYATRSRAQFVLGNFEQSKSDLMQAMRLSPRDPLIGVWHWYLGDAEFGLGHLARIWGEKSGIDVAAEEYHKSIEAGFRSFGLYEGLAAIYALEGKTEEAKAAMAEAQRIQDPLTVKWLILNYPNIPALFEGVRKLGLPEECDPRSRRDFNNQPCYAAAVSSSDAAHLSIVVLPFKNLSGDPAQDYFADGITDNLTTDLSRIRNSFVIASTTAFTYKGKTLDAKEIGKELSVRYVLEGSAQRNQNQVRVNAQLINAETGAHLWAERFEEDVADLFKLQDQVVARLANSLGNELVKAEAEKGARSKNPDAIDLTMRGRALSVQWPLTMDENKSARALFEQALKIDPNDADALAGEAQTFANEYIYAWTNGETDYPAKLLESRRPGHKASVRQRGRVRGKDLVYGLCPPLGRFDPGLRRRTRDQSELRPSLRRASYRRKCSRPFRASQSRCTASDAAEPTRPRNMVVAHKFGRCGTGARAHRRRYRGISQSPLQPRFGRGVRIGGQDRRSEVRPGGGTPPVSRSYDQMGDGAYDRQPKMA